MCTTGGRDLPQKPLEEMRMIRDKPCERDREPCFRQREQHSLKVQVRKRWMCPTNMKKISVSETQQTEDTTRDESRRRVRCNSKSREANFKAITVAQERQNGWCLTTMVEMKMKRRR